MSLHRWDQREEPDPAPHERGARLLHGGRLRGAFGLALPTVFAEVDDDGALA
jgi:hypothetical protein